MVDIDKLVDDLHNHGLLRKHKINGDWYTIYCPFHKNGEERKPSCGISRHTHVRNGHKYPAGTFHCFTCGAAYSLKDGISKLLSLKSKTITSESWLREYLSDDIDVSDFDYLLPQDNLDDMDFMDTTLAVEHLNSLLHKNISYVNEEELSKYRVTVPYMYERKLTDEVIAKYDIGVDLHWIPSGRKNPVPCITFPVHDRLGRTLFICRRSIKGKLFNYPKDVEKPIYGIDNIPKGCTSLIVCESCFNALTCVVYGYSAVALLGTGTPYQVSQIRELGIPEIVLCMDGDDGGRRATSKLYKALKSTSVVWRMNMPDGKDVNDCTKEEFDDLYDKRN